MNFLQRIKRFLAIRFSLEHDPTKRIISFWEKGGPDFEYFASADQPDWIQGFWGSESRFLFYFQNLRLDRTLEIACGAGRHSAQVIDRIQKLYLLDSSLGALDLARQKFVGHPQVTYIHNPDGLGIPSLVPDDSLTAVFSYDALVHFEKEAVFSYVSDSFRKLQQGGYALFHHSNYDKNPTGKFTDNPGWRNFMTQDLFLNKARDFGFEVVASEVLSFVGENSDCITLLRKPIQPGNNP